MSRQNTLRTRLSALAALLAGLCFVSGASAARIVVRPGESIQAAIDRASPGDTILVRPGTYRESLTIRKDKLTLKAADGQGTVLLLPPETPPPTPNLCAPWASITGICVVGEVDEHGNPTGPPVSGTRIAGFTVAHFEGPGIVLRNANDSTVSDTESRDNRGEGISGFIVSKVRFLSNVAHDNEWPGFSIGDSPNANATVTGNQSYRNVPVCPFNSCSDSTGFLFRGSSHGVVRDNRAWGNCRGFSFYAGSAPVSDWRVAGNEALHNNLYCLGTGPSGVGFLLWGTQDVLLSGNIARRNKGAGELEGGIVLASVEPFGPAPTDNVIKDNVALQNTPFDIRWDETGSGNVFRNNACRTSQPSWICD